MRDKNGFTNINRIKISADIKKTNAKLDLDMTLQACSLNGELAVLVNIILNIVEKCRTKMYISYIRQYVLSIGKPIIGF